MNPSLPKLGTTLMNDEQIVFILMEHGIGVTGSTPDSFEIDGEYYHQVPNK